MNAKPTGLGTNANRQHTLMAILAICALFVALLSFLFPFVSINFFGTQTISGIEYISEAIEDEEMPAMLAILCPIFCVVGLVNLFAVTKKNTTPTVAIIASGIGMIALILAMGYDDWDIIEPLDYAGFGFYLFEIMNLVTIVFSAVSIYLSKNPALTNEEAAKGESPSVPTKICPSCGARVTNDAVFCSICGKNLVVALTKNHNTTSTTTVTSINSTDNIRKKCPYCGALVDADAAFCSVCGKEIRGKPAAEAINAVHVSEPEKAEGAPPDSPKPVSRVKSRGFSAPTDLD